MNNKKRKYLENPIVIPQSDLVIAFLNLSSVYKMINAGKATLEDMKPVLFELGRLCYNTDYNYTIAECVHKRMAWLEKRNDELVKVELKQKYDYEE